MAQACVELSRPNLTVEHQAAPINSMIAERSLERLEALEPVEAPALRKVHAPGIYFGMAAEAEYHPDPSLGSTDFKRLVKDPGEFWHHSALNPNRPLFNDTTDKQEGRALHKLSLEGEAAFAKAFIEEPSGSAYPGCLVTLEDLRGYARDKGIKAADGPAPTTKAAFAKLIRAHNPKVFIWDDIMATFKAVAERDGLEVLKPEAMSRIKEAVASIKRNPSLANAFQGGIPEVSVFWVDEWGIPCKARYDYLKPRTIVDLKKCDNAGERPFGVAIRLAIQNYRYDIQARHYLDGYRYLHQFAAEGRAFGDCPLKSGWHTRIMAPDDMMWTWVFRQTKGAPLIKGRAILNHSPLLNKAEREIAEAKETYLSCLERFCTDMWIDDEPVRELTDGEMSAWMRTRLPARLDQPWPGIKAICRIERIRELKDRCSREIIYAITRLDPAAHGPAVLVQLSRDHWQIENTLFHVRDVTFREDHCRVRSGAAPRALAEIRSAALNMIRKTGQKPRPAREAFAEQKWKAIRLVRTS